MNYTNFNNAKSEEENKNIARHFDGLLSYWIGGNIMITFNGVSLAELGWTVQSINRPASPTLSINSYTSTATMGTTFRSREIGEREITVSVHRVARSLEELQTNIRELVDFLCTPEPCPLAFDDIPGFYFMAIVSGQVGVSQTRSYGCVSITFKCNDPMLYANEPQNITITNGGVCRWLRSQYQHWVLTITVKNATTKMNVGIGNTNITLNGNFVTDDIIEIDTDECIKLNGEYAPHLLSFDSRIYPLIVGDNTCKMSDGITAILSITEKRLY